MSMRLTFGDALNETAQIELINDEEKDVCVYICTLQSGSIFSHRKGDESRYVISWRC
jgi:hypothetical protein